MIKKITTALFFLLLIFSLFPQNLTAQTLKTQVSAKFIDRQLEKITQRLQDKKIQDALALTLKLKQQAPNDIKVREMLFDIYVKKKLIALAEKELLFLEKRNQNVQTLYRRAIILKWQNKIKESVLLTKEILRQNQEFAQAHLFLADLLRQQKLFDQARVQLNLYQNKTGKTREYLLISAKIDIDDLKNQEKSLENSSASSSLQRLKKTLQKYVETFDKDSEYHVVNAHYYFLMKKYEESLENIEKALFLSTHNEDLQKQKIITLYYKKDIFSLIAYLESIKNWTNKNDRKKYLYLLGFLHFYKEKIKGKDWAIADKKYLLQKVIPPLLQAHQIEPEDEKIQFFIESLLRENTELTHPLRWRFAKKHLEKAQFFLNAGEKIKARYAFLRALTLSPQEPLIRKAYLEFLKKEKLYKALLDEMMILGKLTENAFLQDYKNETLLELLQKKEKQTLMYQNHLTPQIIASEEKNKLLLLYENVSWEKQFSFPYRQIVIRDLLKEKLSYSHLLRVNIALKQRKEITLNKSQYDYYLDMKIIEKKDQLKTSVTLYDASSQEKKMQKVFFYKQNERHLKMSSDIAQSIEKILPKKGKILKIDNHHVIFSLGKIHGVKKGDVFEIKTEEKVLGPFPIVTIEERISLGKVTDYLLLPQIKLHQLVIVKKNQSAPKNKK